MFIYGPRRKIVTDRTYFAVDREIVCAINIPQHYKMDQGQKRETE